MNKNNIVHFCAGNRYGGLEKVLLYINKGESFLSTLNQYFILCFHGKLKNELIKHNASVFKINSPKFRYIWTVIISQLGLLKLIYRLNIKVIICHEIWNYIIAYPIALLYRKKIVLWIHSSKFNSLGYRILKYIKPDHIICCSKFVRDIAKTLWPRVKSDYVYPPYPINNGVISSEERKNIRERYNTSNKVVIVFSARMADYKGQEDLIEACSKLDNFSYSLWILGAPQVEHERRLYNKLEKRIIDLNLESNIFLLGFKDDVFKYLQCADIYCQPNREEEPFGLSFIDAMLSKLPIITSDSGGGREIINFDNRNYGILVPSKDPNVLADTLNTLIIDEKLRNQMGQNGQKVAREISDAETSMKKYEKIISSLF